MKVALLSNTNIDSLSGRISKQYDVYRPEGFAVWLNEITNPNSGLYRYDPASIFIILDGEQLIANKGHLDDIKSELSQNILFIKNALQANPQICYFISNIDIPKQKLKSVKDAGNEKLSEAFWYEELLKLNEEYDNFFIFDLKDLVEEIGRTEFYSQKLWYLGSIKLSMKAERRLEKEIIRYINALEGKRKKCLVLDLDNTLWGGIIGEEGAAGIELSEFKEGSRFRDFQLRIKDIKDMGIILAVVSKNNEQDVTDVFNHHPGMVLKKEDFVSLIINWNDKSQNILKLSEDLNIGLDSFIFIDDNPIERENVKNKLEDVLVPDFPNDTANLKRFISEIYYDNFMFLTVTDEDKTKTEMYHQNSQRLKELKSASSYEHFLRSLRTRIKIWDIQKSDIPRVSQLIHKTNQFNLTSKRYQDADLDSILLSTCYESYVCSVDDKFGDNGKVAVIIIKKNSDKSAELDTFLMSCRVMGRRIEEQILEFVETKLRNEGFYKFKTFYHPTSKNKPVEELFERLGYDLISRDNSGNKMYEKDLYTNSNGSETFTELEYIPTFINVNVR